MITDINQLDFSKKYTYADYLTWQFQERVELIKGRIFKMSPAPNLQHQRISARVSRVIGNYLEGKSCEIFTAPFDVRLPLPPHKIKDDKVDTVVQPDITVVCDASKLDTRGCIGAPDIVIEILSPGNTKREMKDKLELYQHAQIPEYWLVDPEREFIIIYALDEQEQYLGSVPFTEGSTLTSPILPDFNLDVGLVFQQK